MEKVFKRELFRNDDNVGVSTVFNQMGRPSITNAIQRRQNKDWMDANSNETGISSENKKTNENDRNKNGLKGNWSTYRRHQQLMIMDFFVMFVFFVLKVFVNYFSMKIIRIRNLNNGYWQNEWSNSKCMFVRLTRIIAIWQTEIRMNELIQNRSQNEINKTKNNKSKKKKKIIQKPEDIKKKQKSHSSDLSVWIYLGFR